MLTETITHRRRWPTVVHLDAPPILDNVQKSLDGFSSSHDGVSVSLAAPWDDLGIAITKLRKNKT